MAQSQFENSANQQAVPEGPRPITISDQGALVISPSKVPVGIAFYFPFAFSPAPQAVMRLYYFIADLHKRQPADQPEPRMAA
jgi:hypothetical protein